MDRGLVEHLDEPEMNLCLYGFVCIFRIQYMYCKSSLSSLVSISNEVIEWKRKRSDSVIWQKPLHRQCVVIQHFWCREIHEIVCRVPMEWVKSKFLCENADVMSLADKCIVVGCFVCGVFDKILMETRKFSDNIRVTENGLASGVDMSALVVKFYVLERRRSTWSAPKECQLRRFLSLPIVWHNLHMLPW